MITDIEKSTEDKMVKAVESARHDYTTIRTGRANPTILEKVMVDYHGTQMPINQVGNISVPEPRQLLIVPWDRSAMPMIERAIQKSDLGLSPISDGTGVRLNIPQLTEERRKEFIKSLHKKAEEHRVAVRNIRRDANEHLKQLEKSSEASEDEVKRAQEHVQKMTDKYVAQIEQLTQAKEAELLEV
ncbi:MAG: ribosome recycling factor [Armatimonadota bacterium]